MASTVTRRTPRQERARETMERLLEGAARILEREGLDGFSVEKTASEAGMAVGTEPPRVCQRPFGLSHAASFCSASMA